MSSSSRGRGRGRGGGGGGWGREEWRQSDQESARGSQQPQHRGFSDSRRVQQQQQRGGGGSDWASQQAGCSMQQLRLQPQHQQQRPVLQQQQQQPLAALATSRGVQHVRQPQQLQLQHSQQQGGGHHHHQQPQQHQHQKNHGGRQQSRNRPWSNGNNNSQQHSQQQQRNQNQQHLQHHQQRPAQQLQQQLQQPPQQPQRPVADYERQSQDPRRETAQQQAKRGKRRRQTSGFYQGRAAEQHGGAAAATAAAAADPDDLPGFTRCPETGKYFRITADSSGLFGHRVSDVRAAERRKREEEQERKRKEEQEEEERRRSTRRPASTLSLLSALSLGRLPGAALPRAAAAARMQQLPKQPTQVIDVTDFLPLSRYSGMHSVVGCEFLDVAADGETLTGCWAVAGSSGGRSASMACSVRASVAERGGAARRDEGQWLGLGSLRGAPVQVRASAIVDMTMAPTDRDVTCLLYTTATSTLDKRGCPITVCDVSTRPVCCRFEEGDYDVSDSHIYNLQSRLGGNVYSCAWSQKSMKIGLGMEKHATLIDVMSEQTERVGTKGKVVLSQAFDESGDTLFLGLRAANACVMDMRASMDLAAAVIPDSRSTGWLRLLHKSGPQVVLSTLEGKLCLYDIRRPCVALLAYGGHRAGNGGARLPSFVDNDEQFVFAVGADFATRVWSLSSGRLLHELAAPAAARGAPRLSDYPRPVYSTRWGGTPGQGALLVATGTNLNVYRLGADAEE